MTANELAGTRPLIVYRKEKDWVVVIVRGQRPINLAVGDILTITYKVVVGTDGPELHEMPAVDG